MFKIRFWPALLVLVFCLLGLRLGFWQRDRAHQKEALQAQISRYQHATPIKIGATVLPLAKVNFHRVAVQGHFMADRTVYLDNRPYHDQPGFYVLTPMQLADGGYVLVNRGWLPRNLNDRTAIAPFDTPAGVVELLGMARDGPGRAFELGSGGSAAHLKIRQNLNVADYAAETGLPLQPFVLQQLGGPVDGLIRDWPPATLDVERNYGYMLQWWGMAGALLLFGIYAAWRAAHRPAVTDKTRSHTIA